MSLKPCPLRIPSKFRNPQYHIVGKCYPNFKLHQVENYVVGAPCGVMDQMASACGEENKLLAMVCQVSFMFYATLSI